MTNEPADHPGARRFVATPTSRLIRGAIDRARDTGEPSLIVGAVGVGKTETLRRIADEGGGAKLLIATASNRRVKSFLQAIATVFQINCSREHASILEEHLWDRLSQMEDPCLMIDEAQHLDLETMRSVLGLNEEARLPVVFVGNRDVLKRTRGKGAAFEQIADRLSFRLEIDGASREDIEALGVDDNVEGREAYAFLVEFGLNTSLRQVAGLLRQARRIAGPAGSIKFHHLEEARVDRQGLGARLASRRPPELRVVDTGDH